MPLKEVDAGNGSEAVGINLDFSTKTDKLPIIYQERYTNSKSSPGAPDAKPYPVLGTLPGPVGYRQQAPSCQHFTFKHPF